MKKEGKNVKIWCGRSDLIGDTVMALPMLHIIEKSYPDSYKYWSILRKCSQAAPLYFNHPLIDKVIISDFDEAFGETDRAAAYQCDLVMNTRPHHAREMWHNHKSMVEETILMGGFHINQFRSLSKEEATPKLYKWWNKKDGFNGIAIHCFAGYGRDNHRSPTKFWWEAMIELLTENGFKIFRFGHPAEPDFKTDLEVVDLRNLSFVEQVQAATSCNLYLGTDSGFSLVVGAYSHPQVTLLTNWNIGHTSNPYCLAPVNSNNINLFNDIASGGCSGIYQQKVLESIKNLL